MKYGNFMRMPAVLAVGVCFAAVFVVNEATAQETTEKVMVDNLERTYVVRLPKGYDQERKYPVVILLHGMNQDATDMERLTRFDELADKDSVIAVYPSAMHGRWNVGVRPEPRRMGPGPRRYPGGGYPGGGYPGGGYPRRYPPGGPGGQRRDENRPVPADDIEFLNQMLDKMAVKFSVDATRIYATGLSEGGFMAMKVGCAMSDRIAAIAPVGAAMPKTMVCLPSRPMPVVMINGTSDPVVPHGGGTEHNLQVPVISVEDTAKAWAKIDRCSEKPTQTKLPASEKGGMETKVDTYDGCHEGAQVVSFNIKGAGNTWPGGEQYEVEKQIGKTSQDLNANETIWGFLVTKKLAAAKSATESNPNAK